MTDNQTRPLRFGVVTPILDGLPAWRDRVRQISDSGFSTLLVPDVPQWQPAPAPTLAMAAALAPSLRVGTWVYAAPLHNPKSLAWEAHSLSVLTEGRFELGIGTGRPGLQDELRELGHPVTVPGGRVAQVRDTISALRGFDGGGLRTPLAMAARGPKALALAAEEADTVNFASTPSDTRADIEQLAADFLAVRSVELALHVAVVGDAVSPFMSPPTTDPAALHAADSLLALPSDPAAAIEEVLRRRESGFSYFVIGSNALDAFAPVVAALAEG